MDTIGDFLTMIRNASAAGNESCSCPSSKIRAKMAQILKEKGYILDFEESKNEKGFNQLNLSLKYFNNAPVIKKIKRISKPGCRIYFKYNEIPKVIGGYGISILTTSKGLKSDDEARRQQLGGELLCQVY